ncbi:amino acid ABC transporter permease [Helicobacter sp. 11S02629-2]|uniref:amino acid ABC transporter permease n=1 Tax=Helicobacter sp. 11S02629-2 TaxID=1476195 RepID=UPI000BA7CC26|nr:amino acid ABC transporter permease [Helicobacter sp. 11S02629-2]PAF45762.1 amino acid ABC transporter permease [Helicobacter sp. 11S02629-2]
MKLKYDNVETYLKVIVFFLIVGFGAYFTFPYQIGTDDRIAYLQSFGMTLSLTISGIVIGLVVGFILAFIRLLKNRVLNFIIDEYIDIIRGTPIILQLMIFAYIILAAFRDNYYAAIIALGLNSSAYIAEIVRSGISAIDRGQLEAARAMGLGFSASMFKIVFPQVIKNIIPALSNEIISLFKETSIVGYISIMDLTMKSNSLQSVIYNPTPLIFAGVIYYACVKIFSVLVKLLERRLNRND